MEVLNSILLAIIIILPLGQLLRLEWGNGIAFNPLDIAVFILTVTEVFLLYVHKKNIPRIYFPLGIFLLVGCLGLIFTGNYLSQKEFLISLLYLFRYGLYLSIGICIFFLSKRQKIYIQQALLISGGLFLLGGIVQYFFFPSLKGLLYEGWDPHLYRMFSTFLDPNFAGVFFVLYFLLVFHKSFEEKGKYKKYIFIAISALSFLAVILTFSRGSYLVLGFSTLTYLFLKGYKKIALAIPLIVVILGFLFTLFLPYGEEKNLLRTQSTHARLVSAQNAFSIFLKNPLLGVGFNSYRYAQHRYHLDFGFNWEDTHSGAGANNSFVFVLATTGIIGGFVYGYFWWLVLKKSYHLQKENSFGLFLFTSFIALLISSLFENTLFYPSIMAWMWILVGFIG